MLCPECRRMVGKDGYCPAGHLARPELQMKPPTAAAPPLSAAPPASAPPRDAGAPALPSADPYGPSRFGPLHPSIPGPQTTPGTGSFASAPAAIPAGPPALPPDQLFAVGGNRRRRVFVGAGVLVLALAVFAYFFLGTSAGASNLKLVFTPGETHQYSFEMTVRGRAGNLHGGLAANSSIFADLTQQTGAVDKNGSATLTYTIRNIHFSDNGRDVSPPAGTGGSFSAKIRPDGKVTGIQGGDPFGLEDINPAGQFVGPSNAGPLLPDSRVTQGQSWTTEESETLSDLGTVHARSVNTLTGRLKIGGNDAVVIHSVMNVPLNIHIGHDDLVKQERNSGGTGADVPSDAGISMIGHMDFNLTQTIFTSNGLLQSTLGDGDMRGTMTIEGLGVPVTVAFDLTMNITMLKTSTGESA